MTGFDEAVFSSFLNLENFKDCYTIIISKELSNIIFYKLNQSKVMAYLTQQSTVEDLLHAIEISSSNTPFFCKFFKTKNDSKVETSISPLEEKSILSTRESEVARLLAQDMSIEETAKTLNINAKTVWTYKRRIKEKLKLPSETSFYYFLFQKFR